MLWIMIYTLLLDIQVYMYVYATNRTIYNCKY